MSPSGSGGTVTEHDAFPLVSVAAPQGTGTPGKLKETFTSAPTTGLPPRRTWTVIRAGPPGEYAALPGCASTSRLAGTLVAVAVGTGVAVSVGAAVAMAVGTDVAVGGAVADGEGDAVAVAAAVGVSVAAGVLLGVAVAGGF